MYERRHTSGTLSGRLVVQCAFCLRSVLMICRMLVRSSSNSLSAIFHLCCEMLDASCSDRSLTKTMIIK
uniref:Uncharacterized protein n=1 Tax=Romanomermis culicivorax TaxID=13658 RepID=A0A915I9P2_ROMCU